jgi:hypothetical protein
MRLFEKCKDGGPTSTVDAYVLIECKWLFSVMFLRFSKGSRDNYHSHAFNALTWFLKGDMEERRIIDGVEVKRQYNRGLLPKITTRDNLHKVFANEVSWCFTLRGPWKNSWFEYNKESDETIKLTHGRKKLNNC